MKTVLAYGDSLTWGYDPVNLGRHAHEDRAMMLQNPAAKYRPFAPIALADRQHQRIQGGKEARRCLQN